jgi:hypothetical protein
MADRKISQLTELTAPATGDEFLVVDASESVDANKNKRVTFGTLCDNIPDGSVAAPSLGFASDSGNSGFYRPGSNEIAISISDTEKAKFTANGFQIGSGTGTAQLHTFGTAVGDDVIIENTEAGASAGPNLILYRNSASPADSDSLGTIEFRGEDDADNAQSFAEVAAGIVDASSGSEDGLLDLITTAGGTIATRVRITSDNVGIHELSPQTPLHVTGSDTDLVRFECKNVDAASGADLTFFRNRNGAAGQDSDVLSTVFFRGLNDAATPVEVNYAAIEGSIADASDATEDGVIKLQVQTDSTLTTQFEVSGNTIGFFGATAAVQSTHVADLSATATTGTLPTADGTMTIADAASPTNAELLEYCRELEAKVNSLLAFASAHGLMADS